VIAHSTILGYAAALSDGEAAYLLWIIGALSSIVWALGLRATVRNHRWYPLINGVALLALPVLLLVGMFASMAPPA
jgi:hypothetical protein